MPCRTPSRRSRCASKGATIALLGACLLAAPGGAPALAQSLESLGFRPWITAPSPQVKVQLRAVVRPADALEDGQPAFAAPWSRGRIAEAWLIAPTTRYDHAVLGDGIEAGGLMVRLKDGGERRLMLPQDQVFEDLQPRLADLDRDGAEEIVVVRSSLEHGAVLTAYGLVQDGLRLIAEGPQNLTAHRWLNPVGAADLDGDGTVEIAYVETPHLGGVLRIVSLEDGRLVEEASRAGYSNHAIGSRELGLSAILDFNEDGRPEILLPSARRRSLHVLRYDDGEITLLGRDFYESRIIGAFRLEDLDGNGMDEVIFELDDGLEVRLYR